MNPNFLFLNSLTGISEDSFRKIKGLAEFCRLPAHTSITENGEIPTNVYMLVDGLMRAYIRTENGKIYTKSIFKPVSFVGSLSALIDNKASLLTYESITDCKAYKLNFRAIIELSSTDDEIKSLYIKILEKVFQKAEKRNLELITLDAKDRYIVLRRDIPNIDDLIPQYEIASYLGITPVQLSRIRKKL